MANYEDMRDGFDKDCKEMPMKSATVHCNAFGKTYTFRLKYGHHIKGSSDSNQPNTTEHRTFVMTERSEYQMNRNMIRANLGKYRYQGRNRRDNIEQPRNYSSSSFSETNLGHLDISPVSQHSQMLSSSQLNGDSFVHSSNDAGTSSSTPEQTGSTTQEELYSEYKPPEPAAAKRPIWYAETNHLSPEEGFEEELTLNIITPVKQFICHESMVTGSVVNNAVLSEVSTTPPAEILPLEKLVCKATSHANSRDDIELDCTRSIQQCF